MKIERLDRLKRKIAAMPEAVKQEIHVALEKSAAEMVEAARQFAPVASGDLRNSIGYTFGEYKADNANVRGVKAGDGGHDLSVTIHAGDRKAWYASLVEFGTHAHLIKAKNHETLVDDGKVMGPVVYHPGGTAQPYFFPAYRMTKKRTKSRITRAVNSAVKKVVSK